MPRVTKDTEKDELNKKKSTVKKSITATKKSTNKKTSTKTTKTGTSKTSATRKSTTKKSTATTKKKTTTSTNKKKTTTTKKAAKKVKELDNNIVAEYYDLPYRYNETIVKILYQTPTILFVYWDISDLDRKNFINEYGENFFNNTKPVLKVYNLTKNYDFEVEINDFANSWYINVNDADCQYKVELGRKTIKYEENINTPYIHVSSSNNIEFPNDHILLDKLPKKINFKNIKTNSITTKDISTMRLVGINKIYKVHEFYKRFYKDEIYNDKFIRHSSSS